MRKTFVLRQLQAERTGSNSLLLRSFESCHSHCGENSSLIYYIIDNQVTSKTL